MPRCAACSTAISQAAAAMAWSPLRCQNSMSNSRSGSSPSLEMRVITTRSAILSIIYYLLFLGCIILLSNIVGILDGLGTLGFSGQRLPPHPFGLFPESDHREMPFRFGQLERSPFRDALDCM
jgi:hypothetical protein